jgi:hypothetical protein
MFNFKFFVDPLATKKFTRMLDLKQSTIVIDRTLGKQTFQQSFIVVDSQFRWFGAHHA